MKRDFLVISTMMLAVYAVVSSFCVPPDKLCHESSLSSIAAMPSGSRGWSGPTRVVHYSPRRAADCLIHEINTRRFTPGVRLTPGCCACSTPASKVFTTECVSGSDSFNFLDSSP